MPNSNWSSSSASGGGGGTTDTTLREKTHVSTRYVSIGAGTTGTITAPSGATIRLNDFGGTTDAIIATASGGFPTVTSALSATGAIVAVTLGGVGNLDYTLSVAPSAYPVMLVYRVEQDAVDFDSTAADIWGEVDVETRNVALTSIGALTPSADKLPYFTDGDTAALADFTAFGRSLIDDATAAAGATTLGVGTLNSPEFTAINLGHATDTTIARVSAGVVSVEGSNILLASGLGSITQAYDATLAAWAAYNTNGLLTQTAADTFTGRTLTGTAAQITVTNGDGVAGNPTLSLPADVLIPTILTVPNSGLHILDTNASHDLIITPGSDLTVDRILTITTGDAARTVTISGDTTLSGTNTGDQTITLTGDVTGSGTGSFAATIANDAVTYAKMQNVSATDKVLGRSTAGAGDVEEITCTATGRSILDDASVGAVATTLGLGTGDSPQFTAVNVGHASDTTVARASAGVITVEGNTVPTLNNANTWAADQTVPDEVYGVGWNGSLEVPTKNAVYDKIETLASTVGLQKFFAPASWWVPTVTNGAQRYVAEDATNDIMEDSLAFDTTTQEFATLDIVLPTKWNVGTITVIPYWRTTGGGAAQTMVWGFAGVAISNDDVLDATLGTAQTSSDVWIADADLHIGPETAAITIGGTPADSDLIRLKMNRTVASDNLAVDARFVGAVIAITTDAAVDT